MKKIQGFTYLGVVFLVFLISLTLLGASSVYTIQEQRQKEKELIFIGTQYMNAISSYYRSSPEGSNNYPESIEALLEDRRQIIIKRHLRKPYKDPFTDSPWGILKSEDGGIAGIYSVSKRHPIKMFNFGVLSAQLSNRRFYSDWKFKYLPNKESPQTKQSEEGSLRQEENLNL